MPKQRNSMTQEDKVREVMEAIERHGSVRGAARALGLDPSTVKYWRDRAARMGLYGFDPVLPGFEIAETKTRRDGHGNTLSQTIRQQPERSDEDFAMPEEHLLERGTYQVRDGKVYQKWLKTKFDREQAFRAIGKVFEQREGIRELPKPKLDFDRDLSVTIPIADVHMGLYAWAEQTGTDYDLKIAAGLLRDSVSDLVARSAPAPSCLLADLGDYFHADSSENRTRRSGNTLDVDTRYEKVVEVGFDCVIDAVEMALQKFEEVEYVKLPGNHDDETSVLLRIAIRTHFRNNPRVKVSKDRGRFFMRTFGQCMEVATHGDMLKMGDLAGFAAAQWPKEWGDTSFRYGYTGHIHNEKTLSANTLRGMKVESFNTIAAKDFWHASMGYQSPRDMCSLTLHKALGLRQRSMHPIPTY